MEDCAFPIGHSWETVDVRIKGHGSLETCVVEQCVYCDNLRLNYEPEVLGVAGK